MLAFLVAIAGALLGYRVAPLLLHSHAETLHSGLIGHGWEPIVSGVVAVAGFGAILAAVFGQGSRYRVRASSVIATQAGLFVSAQVVGGLSTGSLLGDVLDPALWLGLLVHVTIASLLVGLIRFGRRLVGADDRPRRCWLATPRRLVDRPHVMVIHRAHVLRQRVVRGPPARIVAPMPTG